jgi:hypothetical protein
MIPGVFGLVALIGLVVAFLDVLRTPPGDVRTLPKPLWLLVVLPPFFGPAAWFLAGRPARGTATPPRRKVEQRPPDDDEEFLRELRRRAEEQRRRARDPRDDPA